jgi:mannose-6-phosphate isomerase-like protein (cupin superfamily)
MVWFSLIDIIKGGIREMNETDHRPWGFYEVLSDEEDHKVKRITVEPGKRLSLQRHKQRREHWFVVNGESIVTVGDKETKVVSGQAIDIPQGLLHRIANTGRERLVYIEVQMGSYFGEDDIERVEDDYGRI